MILLFKNIAGVNEPKVGGDVGGVGAIGTGTVGSYDTPGNHGYYYNPVSYTCEGMLCVGVVTTFIL